nr:ABC transporter permease subunit [Comamonas jiangduensis]
MPSSTLDPMRAAAATAAVPSHAAASASAELMLPPPPSAAKVWMTTWLVPAVLPLLLLLAWDVAVRASGTMLIPSPKEVGLMLWDFAFGGIYDDAFSETLPTHWLQSMARVYGAFALAALVGIPLGLVIGKTPPYAVLWTLRCRCCAVPVTAWLPLSMIFFGVGPNAAIFLVFLGAFFPIVINTTFGVKSVEPRLFEAAAMLGCKGTSMFRQVGCQRPCLPSSTACAWATALRGF